MSLSVSIIICCYNSTLRLPETLRHLSLQKVPPQIDWEILVVDNASTDETEKVALNSCPLACRHRLRVVSEPNPGLSAARIKGIREARHEIVSFVDDDNWVNLGFVESMSNIFSENALIGLVGGPSMPVYEIPPPMWFEQIKGFYAIGEQQPNEGDVTDNNGTLLWGAGLCARRSALLDLFNSGFSFLLTDRKGDSLETGGDTELCFALKNNGWRVWYDRRLSIQHYISRQRLDWSYALRLFRGAGRASVYLKIYLLAKKHHASNAEDIKSTWLFQFARAIKNLVTIFLNDPLSCLFKSEANLSLLKMESGLASIQLLVALCGVYKKTILKVSSLIRPI